MSTPCIPDWIRSRCVRSFADCGVLNCYCRGLCVDNERMLFQIHDPNLQCKITTPCVMVYSDRRRF
jgi:hypothetical protein